MAEKKTFTNVNAAIFECVKVTSSKEHGTIYVPPDANQGTATTDTIAGQVVLNFNFDPTAATVAY